MRYWVWGHRLWFCAAASILIVWQSGSWLAYSVAVMTVCLLGWLAATGRLAGLLAYEQQHKARCRIRWSWRSVMAGSGLAPRDQFPSIKGKIRLRDGGLAFVVKPAHGQHASAWREKREALCTAWQCSEVEVEDKLRKGKPSGLLNITGSMAGILLAPVDWPHGVPAKASWPLSALPVGQLTGARPATISLDEESIVVGGPPGGGKSVFLHTLIAALACRDDEALVIFDLKGVDLQPWRPRAAAFCHDILQAPGVLAWVIGLMDTRLALMRDRGVNKWAAHPDGPHITMIIDEFAELPQEMFPAVDRIVRLGRAAGIAVVTCTQRPAAELGDWFTRIRANSIGKVGMGALGPDEAMMVLGRASVPRPYIMLPRGVGRLVSAGKTHTFRAYWSEPYVRQIADGVVARRPTLTMPGAVVDVETVGTDDGGDTGGAGAAVGAGVELGSGVEDPAADGLSGGELRAVWEALGYDDPGDHGADWRDETSRSA